MGARVLPRLLWQAQTGTRGHCRCRKVACKGAMWRRGGRGGTAAAAGGWAALALVRGPAIAPPSFAPAHLLARAARAAPRAAGAAAGHLPPAAHRVCPMRGLAACALLGAALVACLGAAAGAQGGRRALPASTLWSVPLQPRSPRPHARPSAQARAPAGISATPPSASCPTARARPPRRPCPTAPSSPPRTRRRCSSPGGCRQQGRPCACARPWQQRLGSWRASGRLHRHAQAAVAPADGLAPDLAVCRTCAPGPPSPLHSSL